MYTLLIDTHYNLISLVLYKDGVVISITNKESKSHSEQAMPLIKKILDDNSINVHNINEIIVVNGPGSFTGVRIGVTIAKTLAYALKCSIKTIDSILIKTLGVKHENYICKVDDQNGSFYGIFNNNKLIDKYKYLKKEEFNEFIKNSDYDVIDEVSINYEEVYRFIKNVDSINPHNVNPLYIKNIEV